jgi:hypothetical protein
MIIFMVLAPQHVPAQYFTAFSVFLFQLVDISMLFLEDNDLHSLQQFFFQLT